MLVHKLLVVYCVVMNCLHGLTNLPSLMMPFIFMVFTSHVGNKLTFINEIEMSILEKEV